MAQHQERSKVWRYFTRASGSLKAKCHLCLADLSFKGGSISNLHLHLKRKHAEHLDDQSGALIKNSLPDPLKDIEQHEYFKNDENVHKLIQLVRQRGNILYKFSKDNLWNSETQEKLWKEIAESFGNEVTHLECRQCWRSLRYLYDIFKKDPTSYDMKFVDQLQFLDNLYVKSRVIPNLENNLKKHLPNSSEKYIDDISMAEKEQNDNLEFLEEIDNLSHLNHLDDFSEDINILKNKNLSKDNITEGTLSFNKNFDEMDDLDFFLGFLNKKMRTLSAEDKSHVEMKLTKLVFDAESGFL